ncbi:helix-turn-helix transcriptional regulator [Variovorax sp. Sphag1AA]|uniref:helix-turn-helix transcriptional regulator n=1 Tax=Variovorax sp. Sphag1AA TaxID=2587027 RepID=UPI00161D6B62|nr:helix-turn-helix transcriptional regulator [Variovorax sp. Sphag1AA]MBB3180599.1 DNA-binding CsgD family transcriptional regulator [Variovorax sp. Sphag1AA]
MEMLSQFRFPYVPAADRTPASPPDALQPGMLARVLDEIDHGLLLLDLTGRILHANFPARRELMSGHTLRSIDGMLAASQAGSQPKLRQALKDAERDYRSIVELDEDPEDPLSLAFIPLAALHGASTVDTVLVMCSRRPGCESLTMQMFARSKRLTRAEQNVLARLCAGHGAEEIACLEGIRMSTVRTHIKNVRQKTGSNSIREVVYRVSRMPQIVSALRIASEN